MRLHVVKVWLLENINPGQTQSLGISIEHQTSPGYTQSHMQNGQTSQEMVRLALWNAKTIPADPKAATESEGPTIAPTTKGHSQLYAVSFYSDSELDTQQQVPQMMSHQAEGLQGCWAWPLSFLCDTPRAAGSRLPRCLPCAPWLVPHPPHTPCCIACKQPSQLHTVCATSRQCGLLIHRLSPWALAEKSPSTLSSMRLLPGVLQETDAGGFRPVIIPHMLHVPSSLGFNACALMAASLGQMLICMQMRK